MKEKKRTIIGSLSSSLYTHLRYRRRIFFLFSFRTNVDLSLIIHVTRTPDTRKRSWGICFRCMRVDIFYLPFTLPSHPFLLTGWSMDFPPGILHHLVRVARYVYSCAFIRTSRALVSRYFVREGRSYDHGKPVYSFFLSLRDRPLILIMGIGDFAERQVRCFIFVQSKVAFLQADINSGFLLRFFFHANEE